jgi:glycosyltransferase involved in cell wall biosynthesis
MNKETYFYICLSEDWGTRERAALRNALMAADEGHQVLLYCLKESVLDLAAKKANIHVLYYKRGRPWKKFDFAHHYELRDIIARYEIALVHCFDLQGLVPVGFALMRFPHVPFLMSIFSEVIKTYKRFWQRWALSRVDYFLVPTAELGDNILDRLKVKAKKVEVTGLCLTSPDVTKQLSSDEFVKMFDLSGKSVVIGTLVGRHLREAGGVNPLLYALKGLVQSLGEEGKEAILIMIGEKKWNTHLINKELRTLVASLGLENNVRFCDEIDFESIQHLFDLWVGLPSMEGLADHMLASLYAGVPVVLPRTASTLELIRRKDLSPGKTYRIGDGRELKDNCLAILKDAKSFRSDVKALREYLEESHGFEHYKNILLATCRDLVERRARLPRSKS